MKIHGCLALIWLAMALRVSSAETPPPVPLDALYKPTFLVLDDSWTAGTAFLIRIKGVDSLILITANHLFGPDAGLKEQMPPDAIAAEVKGVAALSMQDVHKALWFPDFLKIPDAGSTESQEYSKDIAIFKAPNLADLHVLELADEMPKKGDKVWLFARQRGDDSPGLLPAIVAEADADKLTYIFSQSDFRLPGTSGAPVLNQEGKVVGMNLAGGLTADKQYKGWANPVSAIRAHLNSVLGH